MRSPLLSLFPLVLLAASGCASLKSAFADSPSEPPVAVPKSTPEEAYNAGVLDEERGDYDAAHREWERCVAMSASDSQSRLDCAVALEKAATSSSALEP